MRTVRVAAVLVLAGLLLVAAVSPAAGATTLERGIALYRQGKWQAAEAVFLQAARAQPRQATPRLWLGITLYQQSRYRDAARVLEGAATMAPRNARIWLWWGHALARNREGDRARRVLEHVVLLAPHGQVAESARQGLRSLAATTVRPAKVVVVPAASPALHPRTYQTLARFFNAHLSDATAFDVATAILGYSRQYRIDPRLVAAVIAIESGYSPTARSHKGAMGLGQLMPATAASLGVAPYDPVQNVYGTVRVLRGNLDYFGWEHVDLALAAYNAGKGAVERYGGRVPPYEETVLYVRNVLDLYARLRELYPAPAPQKV